MNTDQELKNLERQSKIDCERAFNSFMENPMTKVMLSIAPPFEHMEQLLRAAYESGFKVGQSNIALGMVTMMMAKETRR